MNKKNVLINTLSTIQEEEKKPSFISGIRVNCEVNEAANTKIVPTGAIVRLLSDNNFVFDLHNRVDSKCK